MLNHSILGPYEDGSYLVVYPTPGCSSVTIACNCRTEEQANSERDRLNKKQIDREMDIRRYREIRGLRGRYPDLEAFDSFAHG